MKFRKNERNLFHREPDSKKHYILILGIFASEDWITIRGFSRKEKTLLKIETI